MKLLKQPQTFLKYIKLLLLGGVMGTLGLADLAIGQNKSQNHKQNTVNSKQNFIIDFTQSAELARWFVINDEVMGGRSSGQLQSDHQRGIFSGEISLDNNGGFSSVYRKLDQLELEFSQVSIDIEGDGQAYQLRMVTNIEGYRVDYKREFKTQRGKRQSLNFVLDDFKATFRGRLIPNAPVLNSTKVRAVGFLINKNLAGDFALRINQIVFSK
ncbi:CIA30 family protein [Aliikangiella sp. IMCC44653]